MKHLVYTILYLLIMVCIWTDPAEAIPSAGDYTFSSTYVNGTFTSTGTIYRRGVSRIHGTRPLQLIGPARHPSFPRAAAFFRTM